MFTIGNFLFQDGHKNLSELAHCSEFPHEPSIALCIQTTMLFVDGQICMLLSLVSHSKQIFYH